MVDINLPVWDYYPPNNSRYLDNLYLPYLKLAKTCNNPVTGEPEECDVYPFKKQGCVGTLVNENLVRKGWGLDFQMLEPGYNMCPEGWTKDASTGWCTTNEPEFSGTFYSQNAWVPKYQYFDGYAPQHVGRKPRVSEFEMRSINPFTGNYVVYFTSRPSLDPHKYGKLPSKDSLLA